MSWPKGKKNPAMSKRMTGKNNPMKRPEVRAKVTGINVVQDKEYYHKYYKDNKARYQKRQEVWNKAHPEKRKESWQKVHYKKYYNLTLTQIDEMLIAQEYRCLICGQSLNKWEMDHDHITGKVRGILCYNCNNGLGKFKDSIELLKKAIEYLGRDI